MGSVVSTAAMALGYALGSEVAGILGDDPGTWARVGKGFVSGAVQAGLQWVVIRTTGASLKSCLVGGSLGFAGGYPFGQNVQSLLAGLHPFVGPEAALVVFGLSLGIGQWLTFRPRIQRAGMWILISVAGWILTGLTWIWAGMAPGRVVYGIVTGIGLVWLLQTQQRKMQFLGTASLLTSYRV